MKSTKLSQLIFVILTGVLAFSFLISVTVAISVGGASCTVSATMPNWYTINSSHSFTYNNTGSVNETATWEGGNGINGLNSYTGDSTFTVQPGYRATEYATLQASYAIRYEDAHPVYANTAGDVSPSGDYASKWWP